MTKPPQLLWEIARARLREVGYRVAYTPTSLRVTIPGSDEPTKGLSIINGKVSERSVSRLMAKRELNKNCCDNPSLVDREDVTYCENCGASSQN